MVEVLQWIDAAAHRQVKNRRAARKKARQEAVWAPVVCSAASVPGSSSTTTRSLGLGHIWEFSPNQCSMGALPTISYLLTRQFCSILNTVRRATRAITARLHVRAPFSGGSSWMICNCRTQAVKLILTLWERARVDGVGQKNVGYKCTKYGSSQRH